VLLFLSRENREAQASTSRRPVMPEHFFENNMDISSSWIQEKVDVYVEMADRDKDDPYDPPFLIVFNGNRGAISVAGFTMTKRGN
jgi:hypothetical protein